MYTKEDMEASDTLRKIFQQAIDQMDSMCVRDCRDLPDYSNTMVVLMITHIAHLELRILKLKKTLANKPADDSTQP